MKFTWEKCNIKWNEIHIGKSAISNGMKFTWEKCNIKWNEIHMGKVQYQME